MIARVTLRGLLARRARIVLTVLSIVIGVSFVSGAFILTDSFRRAFDQLFAELDRGIDLRVRGATAFGRGGGGSPVPATLADEIRELPGVVAVEPNLDEPAVVLDADGEPVPSRGGPQLGVSWTGEGVIGGRVLRSGEVPSGIDEVSLDETTAERIGASPTLTAVYAVITGVLGAVLGRYVLDAVGCRAWWQRGAAIGIAAHGIGTSRAFTVHPDAGAWASLGMGLHGVVGAVLIPLAFRG
jgi:hypothetical protein